MKTSDRVKKTHKSMKSMSTRSELVELLVIIFKNTNRYYRMKYQHIFSSFIEISKSKFIKQEKNLPKLIKELL